MAMTKEDFVREFVGTFISEHGCFPQDDLNKLKGYLGRAFEREGHASSTDIDGLVMGIEDEDGASVPEELADRFPLLNCLALWGISFDDDELKEEFERLWALEEVH